MFHEEHEVKPRQKSEKGFWDGPPKTMFVFGLVTGVLLMYVLKQLIPLG